MRKRRLDAHSRKRAAERYQLEQHEVDLVRKRVRRFFQENQRCPGNDIVVLKHQSHNRVRLAIFVKGEWVAAVYHRRYYVFVTFLPPEALDSTLLVTPSRRYVVRDSDRNEASGRVPA